MPTRLVFFACKAVTSFRDMKKLSVVMFLPFPRNGSASLSNTLSLELNYAPRLFLPQIWRPVLHIFGVDICSQPKLDAKFIRLIPHILGDLAAGLCGEQLLINRDVGARFVAGYTVLDEPVPSGPHQGKLVVLQTHTSGLLSIKSQEPHYVPEAISCHCLSEKWEAPFLRP